MSRRLGMVALMALTAFAAAPAFSQTTPEKSKTSPGTMATIDRATNQNRATCAREAKAQNLHFMKRRHFIKECMKH